MKFIVAAATLLAVAQARITGFSVPKTIRPGDTVLVSMRTEAASSNIQDVAAAIGYRPGAPMPYSLGFPAGSFCIGSNKSEGFFQYITFPESAAKGPAAISASFMSLAGAMAMPQLYTYTVDVTFGDETSDETVSSA